MTTAIPGSFDAAALRWAATRQRDRRVAAMAALGQPELRSDPAAATAALRALFGLGRTNHFLRADPSVYAGLSEPKMTGAIARAIGTGASALPATQALFDAVLDSARRVRLSQTLPPLAEAPIGSGKTRGRIDLLLRAVGDDGAPYCLAIEAKFGHKLGRHQLANYRPGALRYLQSMQSHVGAGAENLFLVVVAPGLTEDIRAALAVDRRTGRSPGWRFVSWRRLLLGSESALPDTATCAPFRLLLRHLWDRCDD